MPVEFKEARLPNGLTVIGEVDKAAHSAAIGFYVKTGARDEDAAVMGVSHFLEHMMFKGTDKRTAEDVDRDFDEIGAEHNAYTTSELTAFYAHCLAERLPEAEEIVADILRPSIRQKDFDDEKKVIIEEIAMYRDQPFWVLYEKALETYYGVHPLSHRVLGTDETVQDMKREAMLDYFHHRYSADNTVVAIAGRFDFDEIVGRIEQHCGQWQTTDTTRRHTEAEFKPCEFTLTSANAHQHYMLMLSPGPAIGDDRRYAAAMLMQILGEPEGSRLYWAIVEPGLAEEAQTQYNGRDGLGEMLAYVACPPQNAEQVQSIIGEEIGTLAGSLSEDDLERVRNKIATSVTLQGELPGGRMRRLGQMWTYLQEYRSLEDELARINAVTLDDLRSIAADFPMDQQLIGHLKPE